MTLADEASPEGAPGRAEPEPESWPRSRRPTLAMLVGVLACVVVLWLSIASLVQRQRDTALLATRQRADAIARLAEENIARTLDAAGALQALGEIETRSGPRSPAQRALSPTYLEMRRLVEAGHFGFFQVAAIGTNGRLLWSTVAPNAAPVDLSDRVHFRGPMSGAEGLFVGEIVVGRVSGRLSMQISRRMVGADGTVLGVIVASFDPTSLLPFFADLGLNEADEALLLRSGGMVLATSRGRARVGAVLEPDDRLRLVARHRVAGRIAGTPESRVGPWPALLQPPGNGARIVAAHPIDGSPLAVVVALDEREALREFAVYRRDLLRAGSAATVFAIALALAIEVVGRRRDRLRGAALALASARRSEAQLRTMAEAIGDLVLVHEPDGRIAHASAAAARLLGREPEALCGERLVELTGPEERPQVLGAFARAAQHGSARAEAHRIARADGGWAWFETAVERLESGPRGTVRLISSSREIGARLEAERALRAAHARLDALLSNAPVVLYGVRRNEAGRWQLSSISRSVTTILGYPQEAALQPGWWRSNVHPDDIEVARRALTEAAEQGRATHEYRFRRADGAWRWLRDELSHAPGTEKIIGCSVDVTEEYALRRQLVQASKLATLGEMATGMAHEMNQPLAVIGTAAEALLARCTGEEALAPATLRPRLERILRMTHRASAIIDHMRVFGRLEGEGLGPVPLDRAVADGLTIVGPRLGLLGIALEESWEPGLPPVLAQAVPLEQVLLNLLTNACDAFEERPPPPEGRRIRLSARRGANGQVELSVADNAGGIPEAALGKLFEPFFTTKPVGKGTGLGLAVSFGIVRDLGGTLTASNAEGGACFTLRLPAAPQAMPAAA